MDAAVNPLDPTACQPALRLHTGEEADAFAHTCREAGYEFIRFEIADMAGMSRGKTVPLAHVAGYLRTGLNLYGGMLALDSYSIPVRNSGYNEERNYSDCVMIADTSTLTPVPWLNATGRVLCNSMWYDGTPQRALPRLLLMHVLARAEAMGYDVMMGHEYEFYVVDPVTRKPVFDGQPIFMTARTHQVPAIDRLIGVMQAQGIDIITSNVEHGPGQFEINYSASIGIAAADQAFVFKNTVKEYLRKEGLLATFMTKPYQGLSGSCCHFHVSLWERGGGANVFLDARDELGLSAKCRSFIQGVLDHVRASMALWSPTPNCYRRIRPRTYAPSNISWGVQDRSASVRVKASRDSNTHIEIRVPAALSNPYLVAASAIASGLIGLAAGRALAPSADGPKEDDGRFEKLPTEIYEALAALEEDAVIRAVLGEEFIRVYLAMKRQESARLRDAIPAAETNEYFEAY
ncbi:MAG: glutamine synthetase family protein [Steroidobacteraceae bacterium]|jgi:glutamine synthetase